MSINDWEGINPAVAPGPRMSQRALRVPAKHAVPGKEETNGSILFKPYHAEPILSEPPRKWQTRRLWESWRIRIGGIYWATTGMYDPAKRFARLKVLRAWWERLGDISQADAIAEGYPTPKEYFSAFESINGGVSLEETVAAIEFKVVG